MNHKQKVKMARKIISPAEIKRGVPIFQSDAWEKRKLALAKREAKKREKK